MMMMMMMVCGAAHLCDVRCVMSEGVVCCCAPPPLLDSNTWTEHRYLQVTKLNVNSSGWGHDTLKAEVM